MHACWVSAGVGSELKHFWLLSLSVFLCVVVCVYINVWVVTGISSVCYICVCVCLSLDSSLCLSCSVLSCLCLVLSPGSTLSAQSVPTMYPGQLALLAPGGLADSSSSTLLQPLKPSPSSNNLCSAYTSDGALSVPSLCAPNPGRHVMEKQQQNSKLPQYIRNTLCAAKTQMHADDLSSLPHNKTPLTSFYVFLSLWTMWWLLVIFFLCSFTCVSFLSSHLCLFCLTLVYLSVIFLVCVAFHSSYFLSPPLSSPLPATYSSFLLRILPSSLFSGCVKFSWGSERLAFKPGGRRTRFLSTPCLALCV